MLPNAKALRFHESGSLLYLAHKWVMRTCFNAQEEIYRASMDELEQVRAVHPLLARHMGPPCVLRAGRITPTCTEGEHFCGVPGVAELPRGRATDLSRAAHAHAVRLGPRARCPGARSAPRTSRRSPATPSSAAASAAPTATRRCRRPSHPVVAGTTLADRILAFDPATGVLRAEAGLSLRELNRLFLPRGFFTPVTPARSSSPWAAWWRPTSTARTTTATAASAATCARCACAWPTAASSSARRDVEPELFRATVGGMGLTGHILEVEFRAAPRALAVDLDGERAHRATSTRSSTALEGGGARLAVHDGLDRLPLARQRAGARHPDARALGGAGRGAGRVRRARCRASPCRSCCPSWVLNR